MFNKYGKLSWPILILALMGGIVFLLGFSAIAAWYWQYYFLPIQVLTWNTLQEGFALTFILTGLALLGAAIGRWQISRNLGIAVIAISALALVRYYTIFSGGASEILSLFTTGVPSFQDTSLTVIFPFFIVGLTLLLLPHVLQSDENSLLLGILGAIIIALGLIIFLGKNSQILTLYGWQHISYSSMTTAAGLICIGVGVIACAWHKSTGTDSILMRILPIVIITVVIVITLFLWQALLLQNSTHIQRLIRLQASGVSNEIEARMQARVDSLIRMAKRWERAGGTPQSEWEADAIEQVKQTPGYLALEWVDSSLTIRWVAPPVGNEKWKNLNALFEKRRGEALLKARQREQIMLTQTINLLEGGKGFLIYVPLTANKKFDGFILAVARYQELLKSILDTDIAPGYNIDVSEDESLLYRRGDSNNVVREKWGESTKFTLYGVNWTITVWPTQDLLEVEKTSLPSIALTTGLLMALLLGLSIRFAQLAQTRTQEVEIMNHDLKREIAFRERAEEEKRKIEKLLMQSQKLQAIGTLAGGIAHDFNNILYSIIGYVDLVISDVDQNSKARANLQKVLEVAKRAQDIVGQILLFSRQQQYTLQAVSLRDAINSTLMLMKPTIPVSITVELQVTVNHDVVRGNMTQLQQVFINIIKNAIDAIGEEGKLTMRIFRQMADNTFVQLHPTLHKTNYLVVQFQDTGIGMDKATQERIFEPFFTTKDVNKGTGLGMAIAHGIIQDHKGEIVVESTVSVGTSFYIYLPEYADNNGDH